MQTYTGNTRTWLNGENKIQPTVNIEFEVEAECRMPKLWVKGSSSGDPRSIRGKVQVTKTNLRWAGNTNVSADPKLKFLLYLNRELNIVAACQRHGRRYYHVELGLRLDYSQATVLVIVDCSLVHLLEWRHFAQEMRSQS